MKKILLGLLVLISFSTKAQYSTIGNVKADIDLRIVTNAARSITAAQLNTILNGLVNFKVDTIYTNATFDTVFYKRYLNTYAVRVGNGSNTWKLTGNAGTTAGTNFLGTTDNIDVVGKRNSIEIIRLVSTGINIVGNGTATGNFTAGVNLESTGGNGSGVLFTNSDANNKAWAFAKTGTDVRIQEQTVFAWQVWKPGGNIGMGVIWPSNRLSVMPLQYSTNTASQSLTTITGIGTAFTSAMIGSQFIFNDGTSAGTITVFTNGTTLTVNTSQTVSAQAFAISYKGFQVDSIGNVGIGTITPSQPLDVMGNVRFSGALMPNNTAGTSGQVLTSAGAGVVPTWTTPTAGTVTSVSGTANRITSTGGTTPVIDISAAYVGQSSITTLGTIATGTWQGTAIADAYISTSTNWNTAYTDRLKWDGGSTGLVAATGRASLGGTTIGQNVFTSTNPSAITFGRANADNTFDWLSASDFRTAIGAGTGNGTVTAVSIATANGFSGTSSGGTTPALTIIAGAITPTTVNGLTITPNGTNTLNIAAGKTLINSNNLTLTATDGSTLAIGAGGTLGSNAYTSTAYLPLSGGTMVGNIIATDNIYDIGASGATRFRTGYFGTSIVAPVGTFATSVTGGTGSFTTGAFSGNVTVTSASTSGFIVNSTNNASFRGFVIQQSGTAVAGIEMLPNTGEIKIGGYQNINDYFPVIYSDGVASLTFGVGAAPSATFVGNVTGQAASFTTGTFSSTLAVTGTSTLTGNVGIGIAPSATAALYIKAGTATVAPIKFINGTFLTTAEVGTMEYGASHFLTNWQLLRYSVGGTIQDYYIDSTAGGAEKDIYTLTTIANTLGSNGDKLISSYGGNFVTVGTELTQLKVYFAGTEIWNSTAIAPSSGTTSWRVYVEIIRVSSTVIRYTVSLNTTGATGYVYATSGQLSGLTLSNTNILKITGLSSGVGSGSGDIVGKSGYVLFNPAQYAAPA